jgi:hypothetical protein
MREGRQDNKDMAVRPSSPPRIGIVARVGRRDNIVCISDRGDSVGFFFEHDDIAEEGVQGQMTRGTPCFLLLEWYKVRLFNNPPPGCLLPNNLCNPSPSFFCSFPSSLSSTSVASLLLLPLLVAFPGSSQRTCAQDHNDQQFQ